MNHIGGMTWYGDMAHDNFSFSFSPKMMMMMIESWLPSPFVNSMISIDSMFA